MAPLGIKFALLCIRGKCHFESHAKKYNLYIGPEIVFLNPTNFFPIENGTSIEFLLEKKF